MKKMGILLTALFLLSCVLASASELKPRKGGGRGQYSVTEPAAIALLGTGLVSLGIYAKRKRGKKQ